MKKTYSEMMTLNSFEERIDYLRLSGVVCNDTFGHNRYINQQFYRTPKWKQTRDLIIIRDNGCDLGVDGYDIYDMVLVHHINPITVEDIMEDADCLYDPENLICSSLPTHNFIHYGKVRDSNKLITRRRNDTSPWLQ